MKLNLIFRSADGETSMVTEVQLILKAMMLFKERAHGLYEITRDEKFFERVATTYPEYADAK